jgi:hypothetical protein
MASPGKNRQQAEASFELGVFLHWLADEFAKPVHEFEPSRTGEAIDVPLGAVAVPFGFLLLDELPLPHRFNDGVERPVIELDANTASTTSSISPILPIHCTNRISSRHFAKSRCQCPRTRESGPRTPTSHW